MFEGALMPTHWLVILLIVLIVFGAGKLPNVMADLGRGVKEFKKAQMEPDTPAAPPARTGSSATGTPAAPVSTAAAASGEAAVSPLSSGTAPELPIEHSVRS
jgi:sec-independent protein translocase protein TatA